MFVALPQVFDSFGSVAGGVMGSLFFALVLFAALTSSISLMETVVSIVIDLSGLSRKKACVAVYAGTLVLGIPSLLGFGVWSGAQIGGMTILDICDFLANSVLMPVVAFLTCLFIGYVVDCKTVTDEIELNGRVPLEDLFPRDDPIRVPRLYRGHSGYVGARRGGCVQSLIRVPALMPVPVRLPPTEHILRAESGRYVQNVVIKCRAPAPGHTVKRL